MAKGIKTGGRQAGTPNKLTSEIRGVLKGVISNEIESLKDDLRQLEPKERLNIIMKLLPFILPKIDPIHYTENEPNIFEW